MNNISTPVNLLVLITLSILAILVVYFVFIIRLVKEVIQLLGEINGFAGIEEPDFAEPLGSPAHPLISSTPSLFTDLRAYGEASEPDTDELENTDDNERRKMKWQI